MAGERWEVRILDTDDPADGLWLGEMVFNQAKNRFGVMGDVFCSWFPYIHPTTGHFTIPEEYVLTGRAGAVKSIEVALFGTSVTFKPIFSDEPYKPFDAFDSIFTVAIANQTYKAGPDELLNKGAANSLENFSREMSHQVRTFTYTAASTTPNSNQPDCNGYIWIKDPAPEMNVVIKPSPRINQVKGAKNKGTRPQTWNSAGRNVINFTVPADKAISLNAGRGIGYRSWLFTPGIEKLDLTFSMIIYGRPGTRFSTRIGQPGNWQQYTTQIPAAGYYHAVFPYRAKRLDPKHYGKPLCIDWFYNWHFAESTYVPNVEQYADISSLQVYESIYTGFRVNPAYNSQEFDNSISNMFARRSNRDIAENLKHSVLFSKPLASDSYSISLGTITSIADPTKTVTAVVGERNRYGFNLEFDSEVDRTIFPVEFTYNARVGGSTSLI